MSTWIYFPALLLCLILFSGCTKQKEASSSEKLDKVVLQTDWFPQPEHGGFYQALAKGYYKDAGLDVIVLPGGPNAMSTQKVLSGRAHFAMNRADTIFSLRQRDVPVTLVMATLQQDPQALLLHKSNPIQSLEELDGKAVMAIPGLAWIRWLEARYGISLEIIPHDFGMERFLADPDFIQQCLLTNEPFYARQAGIATKVLPLRESGFDPYHGIYCLQSLTTDNPGLIQRFVEASIKGWQDFISGDPEPAFKLIAERNPKMTEAFMSFAYNTLKSEHLVTGRAGDSAEVGQIRPERLDQMVREMQALGLVGESIPQQWYTTEFCAPNASKP